MKTFRTPIAAICAVVVFIGYVSLVRPVGWFDAVVALVLSTVTFLFLRFR
jgi:hypothetical protein